MLLLSAAAPLGASAADDPGSGSQKRSMTVDDLLAVKGVSDPQLSPDGKQVVYVVSEIHRETNKTNSDLWLVASDGGSPPRRLTYAPGSDTHPRWSPDGKTISFASDRGGSPQIWLMAMDQPGEARPLTKLPIGVSEPIWSPDGKTLAFVAEVYPGKTPEQTAEMDKKLEEEKSKVKIYDKLMIRHWMSWDEKKRSHLFVVDRETGKATDLIPDWTANVPPAPFGGSTDYAFSADGRTLVFTSEPRKDAAWSTNTDIWSVAVSGGAPKNLTEANPAADAQPSFSSDGESLAWVAQDRPGFEADLWKLKVKNLKSGQVQDVSAHLDRPVQSYIWDRDSKSVLAVVDDEGQVSAVSLRTDQPGDRDEKLMKWRPKGSISAAQRRGDGAVVCALSSADRPGELYRIGPGANAPTALTHHNDELVSRWNLTEAEAFRYAGSGKTEVGGWLIRPPGFDPKKKYPVLFLIHGGPQGAWHDDWHNRWNLALFAAPGYAVVAVNPRGSTGHGQKFTDEISEDWNGKVYEDLMLGLDHALKTYPFLDAGRIGALGGSYGGYMVNWIAGHSDRFKALISHAGVFDLHSMYFTTEELWFAEWEFGGAPWRAKKPELYFEQSPSRYVANFKTPTLVIHGALDFRVPDSQGLGMFTALQRQGVPSRYVFFPDEGHWIQKPHNRVIWWREMQGWLAKYLEP